MKLVEKASGWLIALGLAVAVLLAFNYLDVFIMTGFRMAGYNTKIYRGLISATAALVNAVVFGLGFLICKKFKRPILKINKISFTEAALVVILTLGMLGFVFTFIIVSDKISEYIKSLSEQMVEYRQSVDRYAEVEREVVPFWDSILYLISLCFIVPLEEELIFRGAIFGILKIKMRPVAAMLITAVIFGIMHRVSIHTAYAVVCGIILTACYHFTENIFATVAMHSIFNLLGSGLGEFLKLEQLGVPAKIRTEIISDVNIICILMMVPGAIAFFALRHYSKKRLKAKAESVAVSE
ncbi:MAG: CPBP family intramembrane metalloprotease [Clostridiales bacterium]|nr:CPBP family intramembrane metalloprotease [Clostridiales bacterium]